MARNYVKGWKRVGAVLSGAWFLAFAGYLWNSEMENISKFHGWQLEMCYAGLKISNTTLQYAQSPEEENRKSTTNWAEFRKCQEEAGKFYHREFETRRSPQVLGLLFGMDGATVALGWMLAWMGVCVGRWVQRGFASV